MKFLKLAIKNRELFAALLLGMFLTVLVTIFLTRPTDDIGPNWQDMTIALCVTIAWYVTSELIKLYSRYRRYKAHEGHYKGYGYVLNNPSDIRDAKWDELEQSPVSSAVLTYQGGDEFILEVSNPASGASTHIWEGTLKFITDNMAEIGYRYKKWPPEANLEHSAGYKRAVFGNSGSGSHTIYVYSNDSQRFGREVFIKE